MLSTSKKSINKSRKAIKFGKILCSFGPNYNSILILLSLCFGSAVSPSAVGGYCVIRLP